MKFIYKLHKKTILMKDEVSDNKNQIYEKN